MQERFKDSNWLRDYIKIVHTICHPDTCSAHDISLILNSYFDGKLHYTIRNANRSIKHPITNMQVISTIALITILLLNISSTVKCNFNLKFMTGSKYFDIWYNIRYIMNRYEDVDKKVLDTDIFNGWKTLYLISCTAFHSLLISEKSLFNLLLNLNHYQRNLGSFMNVLSAIVMIALTLNAVITATVGTLVAVPLIDRIGNPFKLFIILPLSRFVRFFPIITTTIMIIIIAPLITVHNSGIFHNYVTNVMSQTCSNFGWYDMIHISNFIHPSKMCLCFNYFIATDVQLSTILIPLLIVLVRDIWKGMKLATILVLIGILIEFISNIYYEARILPEFQDASASESLIMSHVWIKNYINPYVIGTVFGVMISKNFKMPIHIHQKYEGIVIGSCIITGLIVIYVFYDNR